MILLRSDCLVFRTPGGDVVPCSAETVTLELLGNASALVDPELIKQAAAAVLHYFREEHRQATVSVDEFAAALSRVLRSFGLEVHYTPADDGHKPGATVAEVDLRAVATDSGKGCELFFFPRLREELRLRLTKAPRVVRCSGLRGCVKQLVGARRWSARCQTLSDQIVDYLRVSFRAERLAHDCGLVIL